VARSAQPDKTERKRTTVIYTGDDVME